MAKTHIQFFLEYVKGNPARWMLIEGRRITHNQYGIGDIRNVSIENGNVTISVDFEKATNGNRHRSFGPQGFYEVSEIDLPKPLVEEFRKSEIGKQTHVSRTTKGVRKEQSFVIPPGGGRFFRVKIDGFFM